jgi:peroxiredoxin
LVFLLLFSISGIAQDNAVEEITDLTQVGQIVPEFTVRTLQGEELFVRDLRGKVVLINFFATWCPPCQEEMPYLEKKVWKKYRKKDFAIISIAREETEEDVIPFRKAKKVTFPMGTDPDRSIYGKFATKYIPRNYILDKEGRIVYQAKGFNEEELERIMMKIEELL